MHDDMMARLMRDVFSKMWVELVSRSMHMQGNLRQDDFPTLSGGPQGPGGPPDGAGYGRHTAYDEDERQLIGPPGQWHDPVSQIMCPVREHGFKHLSSWHVHLYGPCMCYWPTIAY